MTRKEFLIAIPACLSSLQAAPSVIGVLATNRTKRMGVSTASYGIHWRQSRSSRQGLPFYDAPTFLDHCRKYNAGGVQIGVEDWTTEVLKQIREKLESYEMYFEGQVSLPKSSNDLSRFDRQIQIAKEVGAQIVRCVCLGGRRYETFKTLPQWRAFVDQSWASLRLAEPIMKRHQVKLAVENHKDWRIPEMLKIMQTFSSEWIGVCLDTGNSISLVEDPMEVVEAFAPWSFTSHFKDMGIEEQELGFYLSEVPLGQGFLDLKKMLDVLLRAKPTIQFNLEMITRDPLDVPIMLDQYWLTMADVPVTDFAETIQRIKSVAVKTPLPRIRQLPLSNQLAIEENNNKVSFEYARGHLGLG